ncbi:MAG: serine/threonine protein kinase, partial [Planctomycetaceae bacterium]|nr:serine/threonine protein kinase [Planctomycetaceae bacterium]
MGDALNTQFDAVLARFAEAWQAGMAPPVQRLARLSRDIHELCSLIAVDLEYRWRTSSLSDSTVDDSGFPQRPRVDDYAAVLGQPEVLGHAPLIAAEYRARLRWGDRPDRAEFAARFPDLKRELIDELARAEQEAFVENPTVTMSADSSVASRELPETLWTGIAMPTGSYNSIPPPKIGKFQAQKLLGRGAFGEVWLAEHPQLRRKVAIKIPRRDRQFSEAQLNEFLRESQRLATLHDIPGVVRVFDADETAGVPYIVSDYVDGESLDRRLSRAPFAPAEATRIVCELAKSLHQAHRLGLTHRDIKPSNILLDQTNRPHLADFGLSVTEHEQVQERPSTVGTFAYMSPEQARGESHLVDGRTDIYSLGAVYYQMLTRRTPFVASDADGYISQILSKEPRPPRMIDDQIPPELERICLKCLRKSVSERYSTANDIALELQAALSAPQARSRRTSWLAAAAAFVALVTAIVVWSNTPEPQQQQPTRTIGIVPKTVFASNPSPNSSLFQVNEADDQLQVVSDDLQLVKFGTLGLEDAVIEITVEVGELRSDYGTAGVFVGLRDTGDGNERAFQCIRVQQRSDGLFCARRTEYYYDPQLPQSRDSQEFGEFALETSSRVNRLELHTSQGSLAEVRWNGVLVEQLSDHDGQEGRNAIGDFGVYSQSSLAIFSDL